MEEMDLDWSFSGFCINFPIVALCAFVESFKTQPYNGLHKGLFFLLLLRSQELQVTVEAVGLKEVAAPVMLATALMLEEEVEEEVVEAVVCRSEVEGEEEHAAEVMGEVVGMAEVKVWTVRAAIRHSSTAQRLLEEGVAPHLRTLEEVGMMVPRIRTLEEADIRVGPDRRRFCPLDSPLPYPQSFWSIVSALADMQSLKYTNTASSVLIWKALSFAEVVRSAFFKWPFQTIASSCSTSALSGPMHLKPEACVTF